MTSARDAVARLRRRMQRFLRVSDADQTARRLDQRVRELEGSDLEWQALNESHHETRMMADHAVHLCERATLLDEQYGLTLHDHDTRVGVLERLAAVRTVTWWLEHAEVPESTLVTVVLPTRNRAELLPRAVASVLDQAYATWQLVVVDDGSTDDTATALAEIDDDRITQVSIEHRGVSAARNAGLEQARGELVTYLDDDNLMHPLWLKAVVWAFGQRPDVDALYGARLADDAARLRDDDGAGLSTIHF